MRYIFCCVILALGISGARAQSRLGFGIGYHLSSINPNTGNNYTINSKWSFDLSVYGDIPLSELIYLQPGITLLDKSFILNDNTSGATVRYAFTPVFLELPVNLVLKPTIRNLHPYLGAGPFMGLGISGNISTDSYYTINGQYYNDSHKINYGGNSESNDLKKLNTGYRILAGIELNKHFKIGTSYSRTLNNIFPKGSLLSGKNKLLMITAGVTL